MPHSPTGTAPQHSGLSAAVGAEELTRHSTILRRSEVRLPPRPPRGDSDWDVGVNCNWSEVLFYFLLPHLCQCSICGYRPTATRNPLRNNVLREGSGRRHLPASSRRLHPSEPRLGALPHHRTATASAHLGRWASPRAPSLTCGRLRTRAVGCVAIGERAERPARIARRWSGGHRAARRVSAERPPARPATGAISARAAAAAAGPLTRLVEAVKE